MAKLEVAEIYWGDVYKDMARIPEAFRIDETGQTVPEGTICKVSAGGKSVLLALRGQFALGTMSSAVNPMLAFSSSKVA